MTSTKRAGLLLTALLAAGPAAAAAAELRLHYAAIEKLLVERVFRDEGRRYLQGSRESKCSFAYVEEPRVSAAQGRLRVRMRFSTILGVEVGERCIGARDEFDAILSGVPVYRDGALELADLSVDTEGGGSGELIAPLLEGALAQGMKFPLDEKIEEASRRLWEETGVRLAVPQLEIPEIRMEANYLAAPLDFRVVLR